MFVSMNMGIKVNRPADTISSILTSGGKQTAMKEKSKIKEIIQQFDSRFNIITAGSITEKNLIMYIVILDQKNIMEEKSWLNFNDDFEIRAAIK